MSPENRSTKHVKHSKRRAHSTIHQLTHQPTPPTNPPTQQPTDARTYAPTMYYSNTTEYRSSMCVGDNINRVAVTLGFPCICDYPQIRRVSTPFPARSPLAESFTAPVLSPTNRRAVVWEGHGATARPREAKCRSGVAGVFGVYSNKMFSRSIYTSLPPLALPRCII